MEQTFEEPLLDSSDTDGEDIGWEREIKTLEQHIQDLRERSHLLHHRLDTIQRLLDQKTFELDTLPIRVAPTTKEKHVRSFLQMLELEESGLLLGDFLRAMNKWLIQQELVDLNDLQIHLTPFLSCVFQKAPGLKKIPYALLLTALPKMFV
jgi:hypothetical protein